jgi:hypothetical protein
MKKLTLCGVLLASTCIAATAGAVTLQASGTNGTDSQFVNSTDAAVPAVVTFESADVSGRRATATARASEGLLRATAIADDPGFASFSQASAAWSDRLVLDTTGAGSGFLYVNIISTGFLDPGTPPTGFGTGLNYDMFLFISNAGGNLGFERYRRTASFTASGVTSEISIQTGNLNSNFLIENDNLRPLSEFDGSIANVMQLRIPFVAGAWLDFSMSANCTANPAGADGASCDAGSGSFATYWGGVTSVTDASGNLLSDWTLTSVTTGTSFAGSFAPVSNPPTGAVPEPASWAMLIAGFGLVGTMQRRRKSAVAA